MTNNRSDQPCSLVTGGAGFIGSHVAAHCLKMGHRVVVLDDLSGGFADQVPPGADLVVGSVADPELLQQLFSVYRFDYVYHLAAYAAVGLSHFIRRYNYTVNLIGSANLINEAVKAKTRCFVFASSISVYGENQVPMAEDLAPRPSDPYGISKYAVELDLAAAFQQFGLPSIVFRLHNVYGEHQNLGDPYRNVLGIFMSQIMSGRALTIFGDGEQTRAFTYVDDVAPHMARSVDLPPTWNQVINLGAEQPYTINHLAQVAMAALGRTVPILHLEPRNEVCQVFASHERARRLLNATPAIGLEEGVRRMADWAMRTGSRKSSIFSAIEIAEGLPSAWVTPQYSEAVPV
jgi:UDP-glucose 4-epimerase